MSGRGKPCHVVVWRSPAARCVYGGPGRMLRSPKVLCGNVVVSYCVVLSDSAVSRDQVVK